MYPRYLILVVLLVVSGCMDAGIPKTSSSSSQMQNSSAAPMPGGASSPRFPLVEARRRFTTKIVRRISDPVEAPDPPAGVFNKVYYDAAPGKLVAYVTPDPGTGAKLPAMIWITGGDCNSIGELWEPAPRDNDQTAAPYRQPGMVLMFPSLRGGNKNPGQTESFLGEVDDVLAAADYLAKQPYVDPNRIYLGGHSTGGTLVLLVAASTDRFRATFSFGPAHNVSGYGTQFLACDPLPQEIHIRSPVHWHLGIKTPVFLLEGAMEPGNIDSLNIMKQTDNRNIKCFPVAGANHFSILAPVNELLATKILADTGETMNITLTEAELSALFIR